MHASLRHDVKFHSSDEPRCAQTAAAFAQGLLNLQSPLPAVQVSFVRMSGLGLLERGARTFVHSPLVEPAKASARALLESGEEINSEFVKRLLCVPERYQRVSSELEACRKDFGTVRQALEELATAVKAFEQELVLASGRAEQHSRFREVLPLMRQRWEDRVKELHGEPLRAPPDKVAAILDYAKYDKRHSMPLVASEGFEDLSKSFNRVYELSSSIASYAELGEYGTSPEEKFEISRAFLQQMLRKLRWDLRVASGAELGEEKEHVRRHNELFTPAGKPTETHNGEARCAEQPVRSRLYFAHHSQMQTLVNLFRWAPGGERFLTGEGEAFLTDMRLPLGYLCHLVLKLWRHSDGFSRDERFTVTLELSPGDEGSSAGDEAPVPAATMVHEGISLTELDKFLSQLLELEPELPIGTGEQ